MAKPYTQLLGASLGTSSGSTLLATVPFGELWVVRDVAWTPSPGSNNLTNAQVWLYASGDEVPFAGPGYAFMVEGVTYQWEGRQVVEQENELFASTPLPDWSVRVTGYKFSTT